MSNDLSPEEKEMLKNLTVPSGPKKKRDDPKETATSASAEKGPFSPAQYDDDGWGDTPVQMRG